MPIRRLLLQTQGGMCNRLRALVSGICWAEDLSCGLVVRWPYDPRFLCRFEDLFEIGSLPSFVSVTTCPLKSAIRCKSPTEMDLLVRGTIERNMPFLSMASYSHFHESDPERWIRHLRALRPTRDVAERVNTRLGLQTQSRVGVHVRAFASEIPSMRPEDRPNFEQSPLSAFLVRMKREDPGTLFVVATNDDDVQSDLEREIPGRCLFPCRIRDSGCREGMKEALVDLLCLARCHRILGTYWSSFTELAADYGGAEMEIVRGPGRTPTGPVQG